MNLLIFGSSIAWGAWDKEGGWAQRLKDLAYEKAENNFNNHTSVYCLGVSGDNSEGLLGRFDSEVKARSWEDEKLTIIIGIGMNDSQYILEEKQHRISEEQFRKNLLTLIQKSKKYNANLIFAGITPVDKRVDPIPWKPSAAYRIEFVKTYDHIVKEVAKQENIPYIELMSKFPTERLNELLTDGLHPSTGGHKIIFEEVKKYLTEKEII